MRLQNNSEPWTISSMTLAAAGASLIVIGLYFVFLRPLLLPEDIRFLALPADQMDLIEPRLAAWLSHVFRVMGGYILATGLLTIALAATAYRAYNGVAYAGSALAGATSIGLMTVTNLAINSDFKWVLFGVALLWAASLVAFWFEKSRSG